MATATFSSVEVKRAIAAIKAVGNYVVRVDFPPEGGFRILTSDTPTEPLGGADGPNPLDRVLRPR